MTQDFSNDIGPLQLFANPTFAHTQIKHPNNITYLRPEDEWKHWLFAAILTLGIKDLGF
jgi:hypothetical protein